MNNYYTYAYLREDGTPYYIGKGKNNRAFVKNRRFVKPPKDKSKIIFLKKDLMEEEAFKHEKYMIFVFGRIDLGTGILHNRTDGGDGCSRLIVTPSHREKLSKAMKKYNTEEERKEARRKYRKINYLKNRERILEYCKEKNKKKEKVKKKRISFKKKCHYKITFNDNRVEIIVGLDEWCKTNGYSKGNINQVIKGKRKQHKGIVSVEKLTITT